MLTRTRIFSVAALVAAAGVFVAILNTRRDPRTDSLLDNPTAQSVHDSARAEDRANAIVGTREPATIRSSRTTAESKPAETPKPTAFGSVHGRVFDSLGVPQAGATVAFVREKSNEGLVSKTSREARTDPFGYYSIKQIPVGVWRARLVEVTTFDSLVSRELELELGEVEILEDQTSYFDFILRGERVLSGVVQLSKEDLLSLKSPDGHEPETSSLQLRLELRKREEPDKLVAVSFATQKLNRGRPASKVPRFIGDDRDPGTEGGDLARLAPGEEKRIVDAELAAKGHFQMSHLEPGLYILRVILPGRSKNERTGEYYDSYIDRDIDLQLGDVTLPPMVLRFEDFILAYYERKKRK